MSFTPIESVNKSLRQALRRLLVALVGALLALMTVQIVMRYGFNSSLLWAEEICRYMLIWLAFLAAALAFERGEVAALTFLSGALPRVPALLLAVCCTLLSLVLCLLLLLYGWQYAQLAGQSAIPGLRFILEDIFGPKAPHAPGTFWVYIALPVGMGLLILRLLADLILCLQAIGSGESIDLVLKRGHTELVE